MNRRAFNFPSDPIGFIRKERLDHVGQTARDMCRPAGNEPLQVERNTVHAAKLRVS